MTKMSLAKPAFLGTKQQQSGKITISMAKLKNKKTLKKVKKLRDFAGNSFSYLHVILF